MLAASYWSLLAPAIELAEDSGKFGAFAFFPVVAGFTLGAAFVYFADFLLPWLIGSLLALSGTGCVKTKPRVTEMLYPGKLMCMGICSFLLHYKSMYIF
ncbi:UNVERIFIED_CONTAM: hypothetical protein K2H54_024905 [Gekko kuhli]